MAQEIIILLTDDLDRRGGLKTEAAETLSFGLRGKWHEIDLSEEHVRELEALLAPYVAAGRKLGAIPLPDPQDVPPGRAMDQRRFNARMRVWGSEHGWDGLKPGGYIPKDLRVAYAEELRQQAASNGHR